MEFLKRLQLMFDVLIYYITTDSNYIFVNISR